ncbi:MAG: thioredoxin domain-containing protein [Cyanobacteria bacterium]|nr:thioredoxin domain-containing protein [Cyanobacteriota bacterium]MDW8199854.1 thioredoxin domain-containing protein [Cyanobacteriota bacterium SKYGB_h_bin112]
MVSDISDQTFIDEVLLSPVPVLVNFWAPWCGLCRLISPVLSSLEADMGGLMKLVDVNADENLKLANTYRLTTLPTLLLFDDGKLLYRIDSFHGRDDLRATLNRLMQQFTYSA